MEKQITIELLREVLKNPIIESSQEKGNIIEYGFPCPPVCDGLLHKEINVHELAHKCKEWAIRLKYSLISGTNTHNEKICNIRHKRWQLARFKNVRANTEPEAIFQACQWILDNKAQS